MLTIEIDAKQALRDLETFKRSAVPFAVRNALNTAAFEARRVWSGKIREAFTTRNTFTAGRALVVEKASGFDPNRMVAVVGSTAEFMAKQEFGGVTRGPIPGPTAAGQAPGIERTKPVRMGNRLRALTAAKAPRAVSRRQRNAIALAVARRRGLKHVVLDRPGGGKGLFRLMGRASHATTRLVWALRRNVARVAPNPTLGPALRAMEPKLVHIYSAALLEQLRRHKVFGY